MGERVVGIGGIFLKAREPGRLGTWHRDHAPFIISYRVENLDAVLAALRAEGCPVDDRIESSEFGRFGWVSNLEGNRAELWEPPRAAGRSSE